jgi:tetratricopeptide (TPR) repeat protein
LQDAPLSVNEILRDADYLFAQKRWDEARRAYLAAAQTDEKSGRAFEGAGLSMLQGEDKAQGIKFLRAAVSLEPNLSRANFVIGSLCLEAGIRRGAVRYLDMATRAAPDNAAYWHQLSLAYADGDCN